jgi:hypothetical protein
MKIRHASSMTARPALMAGLLALALAPSFVLAQDSSVLTYHADNSRSGRYVVPALSWEKAKSLQVDRAFNTRIVGSMYAQPLYLHPLGANGGMLFVATENDVVYALDATTGKELWRREVGRPVQASSLPCGNINPLGITGTPVIDPATQTIYFDAAVERANGPRHEVFALSTKNGSILPGWPIDVADALQRSGRQFDASVQTQRAALTLPPSAAISGIAEIIMAGWSECPCAIRASSRASRHGRARDWAQIGLGTLTSMALRSLAVIPAIPACRCDIRPMARVSVHPIVQLPQIVGIAR